MMRVTPYSGDYIRAAGFFTRSQNEAAGYGAYTYVVFPNRTERSGVFLRTLLSGTDVHRNNSGPALLHNNYNIFYMPIETSQLKAAYKLADTVGKTMGDEQSSALEQLERIYDRQLAREILRTACNPPSQNGGPLRCDGNGPFLVIYPQPRWTEAATPTRVLDLSGYSEHSFGRIITEFTRPQSAREWHIALLDMLTWAVKAAETK